jgi:nitrate/TMAO reductase-like tetraheme cytochrome c subunit
MSLIEALLSRVRSLVYLARNPLSVVGAALTTAGGMALVTFWTADALRAHGLPYSGILLFLVFPALFVLGLILMPLGIFLRWRRLRRRGELPTEYPRVDLNDPLLRRAALLFALLTVANLAIVGTASYRGAHYMDSTEFCGTACHAVMAPEHTAYKDSPHSRVACVACHIGPGASWAVRAKIDGTRQVIAMALKTYSRPIPSPVHHLRPARETCEQCHWPQKFHGDKLIVRKKYAADETNTASTSVLVLKVGGRDTRGVSGIHGRHLDGASRITYVTTDPKRQVIPRVSYVDDEGRTVEYVSSDVKIEPGAALETRAMDCVDCHNRPTHAYELPERAMDRALASGAVSPKLPWIKKRSVELLRAEYPDRETAFKRIHDGLVEFYRTQHAPVYQAHRAQIEEAAQRVVEIYARNVFPEMKLTWGTHPNHIGHEDFLGCFRCHDDNHKSSDGKVISQDCNACHAVLAMEESDPKILADLGLQ